MKLHGLAVCRDGTEGALNIILDYHEHDLAGALPARYCVSECLD